ncbi:MAG TPA: group II intron reverse transcriptase/maturase [Humisphaera sp.]|jgi:RNA-directed DNA polymerase|nr:group II intron reverse transcriptase/maturase [Humisphaera sp.]
MLAALEDGVKGGVWFSLIDKVYNLKNLWAAWAKAARNQGAAGVDGMSIGQYEREAETNLKWLSEQLRTGQYRPKAIRRTYIPKADGTQRPLGIPTVVDRIAQGAVRQVIEPIFEKQFAPQSYGFRPGRSARDALRHVWRLLREGHHYVVDADLKSYFDTIPHRRLMEQVQKRVADGRVLKLIESFLEANIMEGLSQWTPTAGAPQGAVLSPLLSNIYLDPLDQQMAASGYAMVRYADDFVILCKTKEQAQAALEAVTAWTAQAGLTLHPTKTRIVDSRVEPFEFLGYRFERGRRFVRNKSLMKLRDTIRAKTKRTDGRALPLIIADLNRTLRGWFGYFKHSYKTTFPYLDGWVRGRLRSLLRKRQKRKGKARGRDHQRWPNAYFIEQGLYTLNDAFARARQSAKAAH